MIAAACYSDPMRALVLFDIDGTLVDTDGAGRRAMVRAFEAVFGVADIDRRSRGVAFAGMTDSSILPALAEAAEIDAGVFADRTPEVERVYLEALDAEMARPDLRGRALPGIGPLLEALAGRDDTRLALLTGNLERGARIKLEPFDLNRYFPTGGFGSDHSERREVARIAHVRSCEHFGDDFAAERVTVIGDTENDVDCAKYNGFRSLAVGCGWGSRESLEAAGPDALLEDLSDLPASLAAIGL